MSRMGPGEHAPIHRRMFGCVFTYDDIKLLQCKGYSFDSLPNPDVFHEKYYDINYWKAQLAFRGASSVGDDMIELIQRCINAELPDTMHPRVAVAGNQLSREWVRLTVGEDEWSEDEEEYEWEEEGWEGEDEDELFDDEMDDVEVEDGEDDGYDENMEDDAVGYALGNLEEMLNSGIVTCST